MKLVAEARSELPAAATFRALVDDALETVLADARRRTADTAPAALPLVEELQRIVGSGGKRIRPLFVYWGYRAGGGGDATAAARAGAAVELLHTAAVIHDDVIDGSPVRRGEPTSFLQLGSAGGLNAVAPIEASAADRVRFGRSAAILAGDLAQAVADQALADAGFAPEGTARAVAHFNAMRIDAASGEFLDLLASRDGHPDEEEVRRIGRLKSGSYTVVGPLLIGAALAGAGPVVASALIAYGEPLGEAFQIRDDVLGTFGDPALTGKDRDGDVRGGKQTVLVAKARRLAGERERQLLDDRLGREDLTHREVEDVRALLAGNGALAETIALVDELATKAKSALASAPIAEDVRVALEDLADRVALRDG